MINSISIENYRSVRNIYLEISRLNLVYGPNGCGKSNIYNALKLIHAAATGNISSVLTSEGGIHKVIWAGNTRATAPERVKLSIDEKEFSYEIQIGFPDKLPYPTCFKLDPIIREESIWLAGQTRRPSSLMLKRRNQALFLTTINGEKIPFPDSLYENESVFGQMAEPHLYPGVSKAREFIRNWRFYHEFNISGNSAIRSPQPEFRSPVFIQRWRKSCGSFPDHRRNW